MAKKTHERRIRVQVGASAFVDRVLTIWTRVEGTKRPTRRSTYAGSETHAFTFPLKQRQVIVGDGQKGAKPNPLTAEVFVIKRTPRGWSVNDVTISNHRAHSPEPVASRPILFDMIKR